MTREEAGEPARGRPVRTPASDQPPPPDGIQRLWAPWRFAYVSSDDRVEGCPFCVLPDRGEDEDAENLILRRAETSYVIMNAYPYNPGHLMVVPYEHMAGLDDLDDATADGMWDLGREAAAILRERLHCEGMNLGMNLGTAAGAGIADHLHLHVVPRWAGDTNFVSVIGATRILPRAMNEMYEELADAF